MKTLNFKDTLYLVKYRVAIFDTQEELKKYLEQRNEVKYYEVDGGTERLKDGTILISLYNDLNINTVAHECWHALEFALFIGSNVNINLEGHNEHIAYYLGWLVDKVWRFCVKEYNNPEKLDKKDETIVK